MAFIFKPALYDGTTTKYLPQPVEQCQINFGWSGKQHTVPKLDGATVYGIVQNPVQIALSGSVSKEDSTDKVTEEEMWAALEGIKTIANSATATGNLLEFFIYYDSGPSGPTYRKFKECWVQSITPQIGDTNLNLFGYNISIIANDATVYTTAPGA